jgi:acetyltransferase-like isoleucine patch superfamily enzyme
LRSSFDKRDVRPGGVIVDLISTLASEGFWEDEHYEEKTVMTVATRKIPLRIRVKQSDRWWAKALKNGVNFWRNGHVPLIPILHRPLYFAHVGLLSFGRQLVQQVYFTPLFKSRLKQAPRVIQLYSGMPQILGPLDLSVGEHCRISGVSSFFGRSAGVENASCVIGNNVDIGWQSTIAVGRSIAIGDNVRIAGRCFLAGFPGHPEDPSDRAKGLPETQEQVGDIVLEDNVWLASGVTVVAGVTIGRDSIIAAGSVVSRSIPSGVVAGGVPAKVLRPINVKREAADA